MSTLRGAVFVILLCVLAVPAAAPEPDDQLEQLCKFWTHYYLNPQPEKVPEILQRFFDSKLFTEASRCDDHCQRLMVYFFARVAQLEPKLVEDYKALFENGTHRQRLFLLKILRACGNEQLRRFFLSKLQAGRYAGQRKQIEDILAGPIPVKFDPLEKPVKSAGDLDILWTEFMVTGNQRAVEKIISVLPWLEIGSPMEMVIAASAEWSLIANCREHERVLQICKEQSKTAKGRTKIMLAEIIEEIESPQKQHKLTPPLGEQEIVTDPKKAWALGAGAMLTERNHWQHDYLGFYPVLTEMRIEKMKKLFDRWWGTNSREDLFENLVWIDNGGHRKRFEKVGAYVESLNEDEYQQLLKDLKNDKEKLQEIKIAKKYYASLGDKGLFGWDYSRDIYLCRSGYAVGYISEEEAWQRIMAVAKTLQKKFDSWEDLGRNYLIGRQFWSYKYTKEGHYKYKDALQRLLDMPTSPWNRYPWDLDLTEPVEINEPKETTIAMLKNDNQIDKQQGR